MYKTIPTQISTVLRVFKHNNTIEKILEKLTYSTPKPKERAVPLLVVPANILPTQDIFNQIDLGQLEKNTWFLDSIHMYDIVGNIPANPYVLPNVNIRSTTLIPNNYTYYDFNSHRPLTLHETVTLAFQFPSIFNEKISGMQAYGSRFANSKSDIHNADTDDTLEVYRKGNQGNGLLKLAREHHRYSEDTKIIPFIEG